MAFQSVAEGASRAFQCLLDQGLELQSDHSSIAASKVVDNRFVSSLKSHDGHRSQSYKSTHVARLSLSKIETFDSTQLYRLD